jgi:uncharacterized repeat protein (TIGR03837 family)
MRWDIFCQIIDNYGDAGVCWRLARSLSTGSSLNQDDIRIRLFCDNLSILDEIAHGNAVASGAKLGIEVLPWSASESINNFKYVGDVVIEAFACQIPPAFIEEMLTQKNKNSPIWINLEYLTAESWANDMHALPSPQNNGLQKFFYFPGFTKETGGVTLGDWDSVTQSSIPPNSLIPSWAKTRPKSKKVSIFNYKHAPLENWLIDLDQIAYQSEELIDVMVCANQNISNEFFRKKFSTLQLIQLPFIPQEDYDWLLSRCDFNLVRGEDSFVRAQWAEKPFIWDIYPQSDAAHEIKLQAFLDLYFKNASKELHTLGTSAMKWSSPVIWWPQLAHWKTHSENWAKKLRGLGTLEGKITHFVKSQEKSR